MAAVAPMACERVLVFQLKPLCEFAICVEWMCRHRSSNSCVCGYRWQKACGSKRRQQEFTVLHDCQFPRNRIQCRTIQKDLHIDHEDCSLRKNLQICISNQKSMRLHIFGRH